MDKRQKTRDQIQRLLKEQGPRSAQALAEWLELTPMAVRQHLYDMADTGLVDATSEAKGKGRPQKIWHLTEKADAAFADAHADLTVDLIDAVNTTFGEEGMAQLLAVRTQTQIKAYRKRMKGVPDLLSKLTRLAELRAEEGYMANVLETEDGLFLVENHCPICRAAHSCTGLCAQELNVFQTVLGKGVKIERTEHILDGARRCAYKVTAG